MHHGTATHLIDSIKQQGLIAGNRHYVDLSLDEQTANSVGQRHGKPIVVKIKAQLMNQLGYKFYLADNDVYQIFLAVTGNSLYLIVRANNY